MTELAQHFVMDPSQITTWEQQLLDSVPELFDTAAGARPAAASEPRLTSWMRRSVSWQWRAILSSGLDCLDQRPGEASSTLTMTSLSRACPGRCLGHKSYPYLLRGVIIDRFRWVGRDG